MALTKSAESLRSIADVVKEGFPAELCFKPCICKMLCELRLTEALAESSTTYRFCEVVKLIGRPPQASSRIPDHLKGLANLSDKDTALKGSSPRPDRLVQPSKCGSIGFRVVQIDEITWRQTNTNIMTARQHVAPRITSPLI
jgi:hypothetical protein